MRSARLKGILRCIHTSNLLWQNARLVVMEDKKSVKNAPASLVFRFRSDRIRYTLRISFQTIDNFIRRWRRWNKTFLRKFAHSFCKLDLSIGTQKIFTFMKRPSLQKSISKFTPKFIYEIEPRWQCYKTFYGRKLRLFIISYSVCPWQTFPA